MVAFRLTIDTGLFEALFYGVPGDGCCALDDTGAARRWPKGSGLRWCRRGPSGSKPDRGLVTIRYEVLNQNDKAVACYSPVQILRRRPLTES